MASRSYDFVQWAVPRFHRTMALPQEKLAAKLPGESSKEHLLASKQAMYRPKAIAEALAEHPDGAACLYARH